MEKQLENIIIRPIITEKATQLREKHNIYCFEVSKDINKNELANVIKKLYNVVPEKINIVNVKPKPKRRRFIEGKTREWKKAYIKLKKGQKIDIGI